MSNTSRRDFLKILATLTSAAIIPTNAAQALDQIVKQETVDPDESAKYLTNWLPEPGLSAKDHGLVDHKGELLLYSIKNDQLGTGNGEKAFVSAKGNFHEMEYTGDVLNDGKTKWAPFAIEFDSTYYMYFTDVVSNVDENGQIHLTQKIRVASSRNPEDNSSWTIEDTIFTPTHKDAYFLGEPYWSDCRDPNLFIRTDEEGNRKIYMLYTGTDVVYENGRIMIKRIVGMATADDPLGPWEDHGKVLESLDPEAYAVESASFTSKIDKTGKEWFYIVANEAGGAGESLYVSDKLDDMYTKVSNFGPGWANKFYIDKTSNKHYMSYLGMQYPFGIYIREINWIEDKEDYPVPKIDLDLDHQVNLPIITVRRPSSESTKSYVPEDPMEKYIQAHPELFPFAEADPDYLRSLAAEKIFAGALSK